MFFFFFFQQSFLAIFVKNILNMRIKKHNVSFLALLGLSAMAYGQNVGINTTTPKVNLDITGTPTDATKADGLMAPRITGNQLFAKNTQYTVDHKGALVYVTEVAEVANRTGKTEKVSEVGYYVFDGEKWQKIGLEPWKVLASSNQAMSNTENIYQNGKIGIGDFSAGGTTFPAMLSIKGEGAMIDMRKNADTNQNYIRYSSPNGDMKGYIGYGTSFNIKSFQIVNNETQGYIDIQPNIGVGIKLERTIPRTELDVKGAGYFSDKIMIGATYGNRDVIPVDDIVGTVTTTPRRNDAKLVVGGWAGETQPIARFTINNCGGSCGQGTSRNVVFNNTNGTNPNYASLSFVARGGYLTDYSPAVEIKGIERNSSDNYGGLAIATNYTDGLQDRLMIHKDGLVQITNIPKDNGASRILVATADGKVGYINKDELLGGNRTSSRSRTDRQARPVEDNPDNRVESISLLQVRDLTIPAQVIASQGKLYKTGVSVVLQPNEEKLYNITIGVTLEKPELTIGSQFVRLRFLEAGESDNAATELPNTFQHTRTAAANKWGAEYASLGMAYNQSQGMLVGSIGLKNTSSQAKTFYLYADTIDSTNKALFTKLNFSGKSSSIIVISKK